MFRKPQLILLVGILLFIPAAVAAAQDNSPPAAVDDLAVTAVDTPKVIDVAANDSDPDGNLNPASATPTSAGSHGLTVGNGDGTISYFPNIGFIGTDSFTYQICDTDLACSTAMVVVRVLAADAAPIAQNDLVATDEDTAISINVIANDIDTDLDPTSVTIQSGPSNGTAVSNGDGTVTYTPALNYFGPDSFVYQVCDLTAQCATATVSINILPINDPPDCSEATASPDSLWPPNHKMVEISILGVTDVENDPITISIQGATSNEPENGTGDGNTAPDADSSGVRAERSGNGDGRVYEINFLADDGNGGTCNGTVTVEVPHDQRGHAANNAAAPGDFGCDHPGNYCNAPGHNKGGSSPAASSQQQNNHSNQGGGNHGNGNHGNGNGKNANANSQGRGPKK